MNKTAIFYGKSQVGLVVLLDLLANGYKVRVIPNDDIIRAAAKYHNLPIVTLDTMGEFDLFCSCHGEKIIPMRYLPEGKCFNMHDCLFKYKGQTPIQRYMDNQDTKASIESHYMTEQVDEGPVIHQEFWDTPVCHTFGEYYNLAVPHYLDCIERTLVKMGQKPRLKRSAMVRVHADKVMLKLWLKYYSRFFDDIHVLGCETPGGTFDELAKEFQFGLTIIPNHIHSMTAHEIVFKTQRYCLENGSEWFLYADLDEFVVADPDKYKDLGDFMDRSLDKQTYCVGYNVLQAPSEGPLNYEEPILRQRSIWNHDPSGSYNKPALSRVPTEWVEGFHMHQGELVDFCKELKDTGLYLLHFKWADLSHGGSFPIGGGGMSSSVDEPIPEKLRDIF